MAVVNSSLLEKEYENLDVSQADLPIWSPWIIVDVGEGIQTANSIGRSLPKQEVWAVARHAMNSRQEVVAMTVRRDTESFSY